MGKTDQINRGFAVCREDSLAAGMDSHKVLLLASIGLFNTIGFLTFHQVNSALGF